MVTNVVTAEDQRRFQGYLKERWEVEKELAPFYDSIKCKHCGENLVSEGVTGFVHIQEPFINRSWCREGTVEASTEGYSLSEYMAEPVGTDCSRMCRGSKSVDES